MNLSKQDFKFDVTWLSSHFHDLDQLWLRQSQIINNEIRIILNESFKEAIRLNSIGTWLKFKYQEIDNQIITAQKGRQNH